MSTYECTNNEQNCRVITKICYTLLVNSTRCRRKGSINYRVGFEIPSLNYRVGGIEKSKQK